MSNASDWKLPLHSSDSEHPWQKRFNQKGVVPPVQARNQSERESPLKGSDEAMRSAGKRPSRQR